MADKLMQDVDEIESSSVEESNGPDAMNEERMKKEEIMQIKTAAIKANSTQLWVVSWRCWDPA